MCMDPMMLAHIQVLGGQGLCRHKLNVGLAFILISPND